MIISSRILVVFLSLALSAIPGVSNGEEESSVEIDREKLAQTVEKKLAEIDISRARIDKSGLQFDPVISSLDYDESSIIRFVQHEIAFNDYPGALRGALGTLRSKSGNTLDQSLLLATLLRDAGVDARIARGEISGANLMAAVATAGQASGNQAPQPPHEQLRDVQESIESVSDSLLSALQSVWSVSAKSGSDEGKSLDVFWVEYRMGPSQSWQRAIPALESLIKEVPVEEYFSESIPEQYQQRIKLEVFVDSISGGSTTTSSLIPEWLRPTAALVGPASSLTFALVPDSILSGEQGRSITELIESADMFIPFMNGEPIPGASVLTKFGSLVPADAAFSMMGGVFKTISGKADAAANSIANLGTSGEKDNDPLRHIERLWLKITVSTPGSENREFVRTLAEWSGNQEALNYQLTREVTLTMETGTPSPTYFADRSLEVAADVLKLTLGEADQPSIKAYGGERFMASLEMHSVSLGWTRTYRSGPSIVAQYVPLKPTAEAKFGFDIITAPRRSLDVGDEWRSYVLAGVLSGYVEDRLHGGEAGLSDSAFQRLSQSDMKWKVISESGDPTLETMSASVVEQVQTALSQGNLIVFPSSESGVMSEAWWRIDRVSGEVVATLDNSWGGVLLFSVEVVDYQTLKQWITNLVGTHGAIKVGSATTACSLIWVSVKLDAVLSVPGPLAEAYEQMTGEGLSPCMIIPDEDWRFACEMGLEAVGAIAEIAEVFAIEGAFPAFMQGCVAAIIGVPI